ncbi:MAG TPA: hypothetical protein VFF76_05060 [Holophagaceae bacterium]|jgi:hypothetical protein|nr:hypothetical protein [Holophagaceae bacterium]
MRPHRLFALIPAAALCLAAPAHAGDLVLKTSLKYDALCFVGVLTGDPFYTGQYTEEYARFSALMTDEDRAAFKEVQRIVKDEGKDLPGPFFTLYLSASGAETLEGMQAALADPAKLREAFKKTAYYDENDWNTTFDPARPALIRCLGFLKRVGFDDIWHKEYEPKILARIHDLDKRIGGAKFLDQQAKLLGFQPVEGRMTAYLGYFPKPHGIRITGPRYITSWDYPLDIILRNAVHEPMHPPFQHPDDPALWPALAPLKSDAGFMRALEHHDPAFGYNTFEGLVEEDCVQALEQIINERIGVASPAGEHWKRSDGGMHILAAAIYQLMKDDGYDKRGGSFQAWLTDSKTVQRLAGHIQTLSDRVITPAR